MKQYACQYRIVRFMPYSETGEFANIGVCLFCPSQYKMLFLLAPTRFARITNFFNHLDRNVYKKTIEGLTLELTRLQMFFAELGSVEQSMQIFNTAFTGSDLIVSFSEPGALLTNNLNKELEQLYNHFVGRNFTKEANRERYLVEQLKEQFKQFDLDRAFKQHELTDGFHKAQFPLVRLTTDDHVLGAARAITFEQKHRSKVVESADIWLLRLKGLFNKGIISPKDMLIKLGKPAIDDKPAQKYVENFKLELEDLGLHIGYEHETNIVIEYLKQQTGHSAS